MRQAPQGGGYVIGAGMPQGGGGQQAPDRQQMLSQYTQKIQQLGDIAKQLMELQAVIDPEGQALLVPIAQAGKALEGRIQEISQRQQAGTGSPGPQQMTPQTPAENPVEGSASAAMGS